MAPRTLIDEPLGQLFVRLLRARLSGTLHLSSPDAQHAWVVFGCGLVGKVKTTDPVAYLGTVLYEQGAIDACELDASLAQLAKAKALHGQVLIERGSITYEALASALVEQTLRKLTHLFSFDPESIVRFHPNVDELASYGAPELVLVDPCPAIWRGLRDLATPEELAAGRARIGNCACRLSPAATIDRFRFQADELAIVDAMSLQAFTIDELTTLGGMPRAYVEALLYCLLIAGQIEVIPRATQVARSPSTAGFAARFHDEERGTSGTRPVTPRAGLRDPRDSDRAGFIRDRAKTIVDEDYFERLSVPRDASREQIDRQFFALASYWEPSGLPLSLTESRADCGRVFQALVEAYETLSNGSLRDAYVRDLVLGKVAPYDPTADLAGAGTKKPLQGAVFWMKKGDLERAHRLATHQSGLDDHDMPAFALVAWIEAQMPGNQSVEATQARISMLDRALASDSTCVDALYYRAQLHSRLENHRSAIRDLRRAIELDPDHIDSVRAHRVYEMRIRRGSVQIGAADRQASGVVSSSPIGSNRIFKK